MIRLHRLDGKEFVVNADLIETVEATPDTVLSLTTGRKLVVRESVEEVIEKVLHFNRSRSLGPVRWRPGLPGRPDSDVDPGSGLDPEPGHSAEGRT